MHSQIIRPAAVAGSFYPGSATTLGSQVSAMLAAAAGFSGSPKALIAPHAGYVYSGPTAACAYAALRNSAAAIRRVVIFGPAHRVWVAGLAATSATAFATPFGSVPVDQKAIAEVMQLPQVTFDESAHAQEHSIEVQLPFLQTVLSDFALVPFVVGGATPAEVAEVMDVLWGGPETLIVVSSDLSHFLSYGDARQIDRATADSILETRPLSRHEQACGATPINGLLLVARRRNLAPMLLDLRNSGDTAGDRDRVVGYGAFAFLEHNHV
jgi:AmmeMemoRadiSam system protein B